MRKSVVVILALIFAPIYAFAVDGVVLINQSTVMTAGGFPYTISQPGSYRLSGNLTVPNANAGAILITTDNVTLDLNGFSIIGPVVCSNVVSLVCSGSGSGVGIQGAQFTNNITVVNGTVRGMGSCGIVLGQDGTGNSVEKVHAYSNGGCGISVFFGTVSGNTAYFNGTYGFYLDSATVTGNVASFNGGYGIFANCPSSIVGNTLSNNHSGNLFAIGITACAVANNAAP